MIVGRKENKRTEDMTLTFLKVIVERKGRGWN